MLRRYQVTITISISIVMFIYEPRVWCDEFIEFILIFINSFPR